jgi:hypothetical protein
MAKRYLIMEDREIDRLEGLLKALRNIRGEGGIEVKVTPGQAITISQRPQRQRHSVHLPTFWARLTTADGDEYDFRQQRRKGDGSGDGWEDLPGGLTSEEAVPAMNRTGVKALSAFGVDKDGGDYPAGMDERPIGGAGTSDTHKYDVPVWMHEVTDVNGDKRYWFYSWGSHDGSCE